MSLARKIAHNTIIQYAGKTIGTVLGLITIGFMTRYLGQDGFGYYTTIMGFLQFFGILVDFGLSLTTAQMLGHSKWNEDQVFANILTLRIFSAIVFLGLAPLVVVFFPYPNFVKLGIALTTTSFFFMALSQIFLGFYQKHLKLSYHSYAEIGNRIFLLIAVLASVYFDWGLFGILISVILSNAVQLLMLYIPARKLGRIYLNFNTAILKDIWMRTWPIAVSIALNLLYLKTDVIVLSVVRPAEEVGLYGAAYKVIEVLTTFPILFAGILLPLLSRFWQTNETGRFKKLVQQGFDAMSLLAWPIMVGTLFVGNDLMAFIAGEEFRDSGLILQLLIWASGMIFFNAVFAHAIVALEKQKQTIWAYGVTAILGLIGYIIFIPRFGALGAAAMTVITEGVVALLVFLLYVKFSKIVPSFKIWFGSLISCAAMAGALYKAENIHFLWQILLAMAVYGLMLIITRTVSREFIRDILTLRRFNGSA